MKSPNKWVASLLTGMLTVISVYAADLGANVTQDPLKYLDHIRATENAFYAASRKEKIGENIDEEKRIRTLGSVNEI